MKHLLLLSATLACSVIAIAQDSLQRKVTADKIVGIVGDNIIRRSDVYNDILDRERRDEYVPQQDAACYSMEQLLLLKALLLQAQKDSVEITGEELETMLDNQVRVFMRKYGTKEELERIAGRSVYQIKEDLRPGFKEYRLAERMREKIVYGLTVTPQEVKACFDKLPKDSLPWFESEVELGEIIVYPKASRDLEKLAKEELAEYKKAIESGQQRFATMAGLYSDDPAAKYNGGQYTISRTDKTVNPPFVSDEFIHQAFRLKEKQVSPVFSSKEGYHIIVMESRAGDDAVVRHILRIPKITDAETNEAMEKLDSVRSKLMAGTLSFGEAAVKYSEDPFAKHTAGMLQWDNGTRFTIGMLDKDRALVLKDMKPGAFSKPTVFTDERDKKGVRILYLKSRTTPHQLNLKDDYDRLAQQALEIKKQEALQKWLTAKIPGFYIMIDDEFKNCKSLNKWFPRFTAGKP
jgi:peptidyl-prolyl cis-trans isomerase SurA